MLTLEEFDDALADTGEGGTLWYVKDLVNGGCSKPDCPCAPFACDDVCTCAPPREAT